MKHKALAGAVTLAAVSLVLAGCSGGASTGSTGKESKGPITIGMVAPVTGAYAPLGSGDKAAAQLEVDAINKAGGVNGRQLKLIVQDDTTDVTKSVQLFNQLAANKDVSAVLTSSFASASAAVGPVAQSAKVPILAHAPLSDFRDGSNTYAFTVPATPELYAQEEIGYFQSIGLTKLAIGYTSGDAYGESGNKATLAAAKKAGIDVVLDEGFDQTATDFTPLITHTKSSGAKGLLVWGAGPAPVIITKQLQGTGIQPYMTGAEATTLYTQPAGAAAEGVVMSSAQGVAQSALQPGKVTDAINTFVDAWKGANKGQLPPQFAFDGAAGIQLIAAAIEKAGSSDRDAVRDALEHSDAVTVDGQFHNSASNHAGLTVDDTAMVEVKGGQFVPTDYTVQQYKNKK
jgi:branched-chain amino acid transport system substrate-binding protein